MKVQAIGIDCWKDPIFHLVGLDRPGHIARKKRFSQTSLCLCGEPATCLVGMEACCVTPDHLTRAVRSSFREVQQEMITATRKPSPAAVHRPTIRVVPIKMRDSNSTL